MKLPIEMKTSIESLQFYVYDLKENENGIKLIFYVFNKFNFMKHFQIDNETLFTALCAIRDSYHNNIYHNWMHAVESVQFLMYSIEKAKLLNVLDISEIFSFFVAVLFEFSEHDGTYKLVCYRKLPLMVILMVQLNFRKKTLLSKILTNVHKKKYFETCDEKLFALIT